MDKIRIAKNEEPLVSVVIAVKNGERFIETAVESVLSQTYSHIEIIVVDGNSTDRTLERIKRFGEVKIFSQQGKGIGNAYNEGIAASRGDYISFLSSDDFWTPDKIAKQISALQDRLSPAFAVCSACFFLDDPASLPPGFRPELLNAPRVAYIMETLIAHRNVFSLVGSFDEEMLNSEDVDWFARAFDMQIESIVIPEVLLHKRIHDRNLHLVSSTNNHDLLRAVKNSFVRKRESLKSPKTESTLK